MTDREADGGGRAPALVAVAHGSRDPRSAATIAALADEVRAQARDLDVRVGFLDLSAPRLSDVLDGVAADGHRRAVVVPLLLGDAFHARADVPAAVAAAGRRHPRLRIDVAGVLGDDPGTDDAALARLRAAVAPGPHPHDVLHDPGLGVVLASVGSSREGANRVVAERVARWRARFGWAAASPAYATAAEPTPERAIAAVRAAGARRVAVVPWVLAPGRLPDRIEAAATAAGALLADPIGPHPELAAVVLRRWSDAAAEPDSAARRGVGA